MRNSMLEQPLFSLTVQASSFVINFCDLLGTMPRHCSPLSFLTKPTPREAENFPRDDKHPKNVSLFTCFACFSTKVLVCRFYLCVTVSRETLYTPLSGFEPTL